MIKSFSPGPKATSSEITNLTRGVFWSGSNAVLVLLLPTQNSKKFYITTEEFLKILLWMSCHIGQQKMPSLLMLKGTENLKKKKLVPKTQIFLTSLIINAASPFLLAFKEQRDNASSDTCQ